MNLVYAPGSQLLLARPGLAVLTPDQQLARRAWSVVGTDGHVDELLVELIRGGLPAVGAFVLVDTSDERVRVLVRGDLSVQVRGVAGSVSWTGAGVTTWVEQVFDQVDGILVGEAEPTAGTDGAAAQDRLPLRDGMVRCSGFELRRTDRARAVTARPTTDPVAADSPPVPASRPVSPSPAPPDAPVSPVVIASDQVESPPAESPPAESPPAEEWGSPDTPLTPPPGASAGLVKPVTLPERSADPAQTRTEAPEDGFDHLFESTIFRSVEDAAVRDVHDDGVGIMARPEENGAASEPRLGDHDGYTITAAQLGVLRQQSPGPDSDDPPPPAGARLELSTGEVVELDRDVVIGRRPEVDRVQGGRVPTVLTVPSPQQDVSRTHLRIGWSGRKMLATDLHSMNGTVLIGADGSTRALDGGVPHALADGDTLDIGDGITATLRLTPA